MWHLFLDESGDLGFDFENKNPSRFLTLSILAVSQRKCAEDLRYAVKKTLKRKVNNGKKGKKRPEIELKGASTSLNVKKYFYSMVADTKFGIYSMTLNKKRVHDELCNTARSKDRLYNFVAHKVIEKIPFEVADRAVYLVVDRSKGKKGITGFNQYIQRELEGRLDPRATLNIKHQYSHVDLGLSAADVFCWGIFRRRERLDSDWYSVFKDKVQLDEQYL